MNKRKDFNKALIDWINKFKIIKKLLIEKKLNQQVEKKSVNSLETPSPLSWLWMAKVLILKLVEMVNFK